jgi:hypothetical protein
MDSKLKFHTRKSCEQRLSGENVFQATAGEEAGESGANHNVLAQGWPVFRTNTQVGANGMMNRPLE